MIYWLAERDPILRPMTILVLLACLSFRMEERAREIAGVPLTLAAIKLAYRPRNLPSERVRRAQTLARRSRLRLLGGRSFSSDISRLLLNAL